MLPSCFSCEGPAPLKLPEGDICTKCFDKDPARQVKDFNIFTEGDVEVCMKHDFWTFLKFVKFAYQCLQRIKLNLTQEMMDAKETN